MVDATPLMTRNADWFNDHLRRYLEDGEEAHFLDLTEYGGKRETPTLVVRTLGRKSGSEFLVPLVYMPYNDAFIIAASKGGHDEHPQWYLNLTARPEVEFKVRSSSYLGRWRLLEGAERSEVWDMLVAENPFYHDYEVNTDRVIPVIALVPERTVDTITDRVAGAGLEAFNRAKAS